MDSYLGIPIAMLMLGAGVLILILALLWIALPFALFGTKPLLRQILAEAKRTNELLESRLLVLRSPTPVEETKLPPIFARRD
jgi:hypothetical protein